MCGVLVLVAVAIAFAAPLQAATFTVDTDGSDPDQTINGTCARAGGGCTLHAAIQEANATPAADTITFSINSVTLAASLPQILFPVTIDGGGSPRVQLIGGAGLNGISLTAGAGSNTPGGGSMIQNLQITNMGGAGISIVGGGNSVQNCWIGTDGANALPNNGAGISITTPALGPFANVTDINTVAGNLIGDPADGSKGNLISGNAGAGIDIFAERTVKNVVANNIIGLNAVQMAALPNGSHGVRISGNAFANTIGPANVIAGNNNALADGINVGGAVWQANVITGNFIGSNASGANFGNGLSGIHVDATKYDGTVTHTTDIGPNNSIVFNNEHGVFITGAAQQVWVHGNFIGVRNGVPLGLGNLIDGIRITTAGHKIGGSLPGEGNVISANEGSGIVLQSSSATDNVIQGNLIGRDSLNAIDISNTFQGILITNGAGGNLIGGGAPGEGNIIAGNGRNGVQLFNATSSNLISGNSIFNSGAISGTSIGIDVDQTTDGKDSTTNATPGIDPNTLYSNWGQNAPVLGNSGANVPHYDPSTGNLLVPLTLETVPLTPVRLEFFASDTANNNGSGDGRTYLGFVNVVTAGDGTYAGTATVVPSMPLDTRGKQITATATTLQTIDPPGALNSGPANNTSEFSNAGLAPDPGQLQFSAATYNVGEAGPFVTITVTRTGGSDGAVSIDYATSDGSAAAGFDYTAASGTLNWADGESTSKTFDIAIADDSTYEGSETVNLALSNPGGYAELGTPGTAVLTINDNDTQPSMSIDSVTMLEGAPATTASFSFTVSLSNLSAFAASATVNTADGTATVANGDYDAITNGTITIPAGTLSTNVVVAVNGDNTPETNEIFTVNLSGISGASAGTISGLGTITNDDNPQPTFLIDDVSADEGLSGITAFTFTVSLNPAAASTVSVDVATSDGSALAGSDYTSKTQTLTFNAGETSKTFVVDVGGDAMFESNETFNVTLSNASAGTLIGDASGLGTITNDDTMPAISINDVSQLETNAGTTNFVFDVTLSNPSAQTITVDYATSNVSATAGSDYTGASNTLTFASGVVMQQIVISVNGDATDEGDETFAVTLSNPANATLFDDSGTGTIQNDDSATPTFSINSIAQNEGSAGTAAFTFTVTLSPLAATTTAVQATIADGTASSADADFAAMAPVTLTFNAGVATQQITVNVNGDTKLENSETFTVTLSANSAGTAIGLGSGTGTITNDDAQPQMLIQDVAQLEGNAGTTAFLFTVTLSNPSAFPITVNYLTSNGTATAGSDYTTTSGTLTFPPGSTTQSITVFVNGDLANEGGETFFMTLSGASGASIVDAQAQATIQNDPQDAAATANVPALGARELALLALALAAVAMIVMKRA
ncbi:MAG TPA: Calx-beta domain-containing protein [Thermoanaerobaculia bacterium]|nr:Calx-beta domain-containing protein [Thermoanaerobaculia bacterium]